MEWFDLYIPYVKCTQPRQEFELGSLYPFSTTFTPRGLYINIYIWIDDDFLNHFWNWDEQEEINGIYIN